ncbi:MAG: hypothetical protein ABSD97_14600, partial [Acidimicrobiales bacterium]
CFIGVPLGGARLRHSTRRQVRRHRTPTVTTSRPELERPPGPVSFRCRPVGRTANSVATSWITL